MSANEDTPEAVLTFWFGGTDAGEAALKSQQKIWFGGGSALDEVIRTRFSTLLDRLAGGEARTWAALGVRQRLAAVIVLDQFSRSIHRGTPRAFATDPMALSLAREAIDAGEDRALEPLERWFLYMPLEHSEAIRNQHESVAKFEALEQSAPTGLRKAIASALDYARKHLEVIEKFGRFPHRNGILGRGSTPEEAEYVKTHGGF